MSYNNPEILDLYNMKNSLEFLWFNVSNYTQNVIEPGIRYFYQNKYEFYYNETVIILSFMAVLYSLLLQVYLFMYGEKLYKKYINLLEEYNFTVRSIKNRKIEIEKLKNAIKTRNQDLYINDKELEIADKKIYQLEKNIKNLKNTVQSINKDKDNNFHMTLRKKRRIN